MAATHLTNGAGVKLWMCSGETGVLVGDLPASSTIEAPFPSNDMPGVYLVANNSGTFLDDVLSSAHPKITEARALTAEVPVTLEQSEYEDDHTVPPFIG